MSEGRTGIFSDLLSRPQRDAKVRELQARKAELQKTLGSSQRQTGSTTASEGPTILERADADSQQRVEDALEAVRSAQLEGVIIGGGSALVKCAANVKNIKTENDAEAIGVRIVKESVADPLKQMALNAGESPDLILNQVLKLKGDRGYDFKNSQVVDMIEKGIVDPVKVTKTALKNACSVASTLITTNYAIVEVESKSTH